LPATPAAGPRLLQQQPRTQAVAGRRGRLSDSPASDTRYGENTTARGPWRIAGRVVDPAQLSLPTLALIPEGDRIVQPASALGLANALPDRQIERPPLGHIGMVVSGQAKAKVWEALRLWCAG